MSLLYGPDGGVFMSDWCDAGECHDYIDIHRENGRIYKVTYGTPISSSANLAKLSDAELVNLQLHKNEWFVSHARLLLQERAVSGKLEPQTRPALLRMLREQTDATRRLRALWALHVTGGLEDRLAFEILNGHEEWLRAWTIQLALETAGQRNRPGARDGGLPSGSGLGVTSRSPQLLKKLAELAASDPSPVVRLYLASGLQRLTLNDRLPIAERLVAHREDDDDANLPLLLWYGIEPIAASDDEASATLLAKARIPLVRQVLAQRLALRLSLDQVVAAIRRSEDTGFQRDLVRGMFDALNGRRDIRIPKEWRPVEEKLNQHPDADVTEQAVMLSLVFGDPQSSTRLRGRVTDTTASPASRQRALQALVQGRVPDLIPLLDSLLSDADMRSVAIRGLAAFDDPATPGVILDNYAQLSSGEKADAITTLVARPDYAVALLEAVKRNAVPARDISPFAARQIQALKDPRIGPLFTGALGGIRSVSQDKSALIARFRELLRPDALKAANPSRGRALFNRTCASCHTLFGEGGRIGPELTGSQRSSLDYLLENVVDPNAVVWNQYRAVYFETSDDRLISGIVLRENEGTVTIQTQTGTVTLPRADITRRTESTLSMMPEGLLESLKAEEVLDLVAYLQSPSQVPLPDGR